MRVALDTNAYAAIVANDTQAQRVIQEADEIYIPLIVLGELRAGFMAGSRTNENEARLTRFLHSPRVQTLVPDAETSHVYARLFAQLRKQGTPIPTNDIWIAALVLQHDLCLLARGRHFDHLPQLLRA